MGHRWLLGPLICLILATTSARPPECQEPPSWSINGLQPMAETKGKATMLEALLNHFRSYGMEDLEFVIVNSKLSHAQDKLHELQKRVSFQVHQETDEEDVWNVLQGGKDDMYVYDRCGRLTYYIPFPLSILNESPLVSNAILATYFRSPCGDNCDTNQTLDYAEFVESNFELENTTDEENSTFITETEMPIFTNETSTNETQYSDDLPDLLFHENQLVTVLNSTNVDNVTDYDYPAYDNIQTTNETNSTNVVKAKSFFSSIYKMFFNEGNDDKMPEISNSTVLNVTSSYESAHSITAQKDTKNETMNMQVHSREHAHHKHGHGKEHEHGKKHEHGKEHEQAKHEHSHSEPSEFEVKKKSGRCLEADYEVCKSWSKKRLLHAQKCCSEIHLDLESQHSRSCSHFGKKRCKKMQSILKCCIKTAYTEPSTTMLVNEETTALTPPEESAILTEDALEVVTEDSDLVCCKTINVGKLCRVTYLEKCEDGEFTEKSPKEKP